MSTPDKFTRKDFQVGDKVKVCFASQFAGQAEEVGIITEVTGLCLAVTSPYLLNDKEGIFWLRTGLQSNGKDDYWLEDASAEEIRQYDLDESIRIGRREVSKMTFEQRRELNRQARIRVAKSQTK